MRKLKCPRIASHIGNGIKWIIDTAECTISYIDDKNEQKQEKK